MGRFTEKQLTIMTIVVSVVVSGLFGVLIYLDLGKIDEEESNIETLKSQIAAAEAEKARIPKRENDVIIYREIVKRDSAVLPDESEINKFINVIGDFQRVSGVQVTQVQGLGAGRPKGSKEAIIKIPLKLKLRGSTDQFLKFINLFENYERFVSVTGFTIGAGKSVDENGVVQHDISLNLETYQYDPKGGTAPRVEILDYERRKQDLAVQKEIRSIKAASIEKYTMKPRISRRDPLVDPREAETAPDADGKDPVQEFTEQKALLDKLVLDMSLLQDDVRFEEKLKANDEFMRLAMVGQAIDQRIAQLDYEINRVLSEKRITIAELRDRFAAEVVQPFEQVKERRKGTEAVPILVERKTVFETLQKMREEFEGGNYRDVLQIYEGFVRSLEGRKLDPSAEPLRREMEVQVQQAQVISKFDSEPLHIDGVIIDAKRTSYAIINELIVAEGDFVDGDRKIRIREIRPDSILFEFEGVVIPKQIRKK